VVEDVGSRVLLCGRERAERTIEVVLDDLLGAAQRSEGLLPKHRGPALALDLPQALKHELEVRRLHTAHLHGAFHCTSSGQRGLKASCRDLVEHVVHQSGLDLHRAGRPRDRGKAAQRTEDRLAPRGPVELVEAKGIHVEPGDSLLEDVELSKCVVADTEQDVDSQSRTENELREQIDEARCPLLGRVVQKEFLELVDE